VRLLAPTDDIVVITSEEPFLRGSVELRHFLGPLRRRSDNLRVGVGPVDVSTAGPIAWLLAEGTETATSEDHVARHRYRMTMVLEGHRDHWLVRQVHGSSPHRAEFRRACDR
jgi:ketosteroid isomerase-like protein